MLAVLAHPDDESYGMGGTLARYAREGVDVHVAIATDWMKRLNRDAARALQALAVHAVTDVTGYGLAGHSWEMAERSDVRVVVAVHRLFDRERPLQDQAGLLQVPQLLVDDAEIGLEAGAEKAARRVVADDQISMTS